MRLSCKIPHNKEQLVHQQPNQPLPNTATLTQSYAESGLANLQIKCPSNNTRIPTGRTLRAKTQRLNKTQIRSSLTATNDQMFHTLKSRGILKRKATIAINYPTNPSMATKTLKRYRW
jgi:hypothetical protein